MQPLVVHEHVAHTAMQVMLYSWAAAEIALQLRARLQGGRGSSDWTFYVVVGSIVAAFVASDRLIGVHATRIGGGYTPVTIGLVLLAAGVLFRLWAVVALGRLFTFRVAIQSRHRLVRTGPYRFVRHPSYSGVLLACVGIGVADANLLCLAVLLLLPLAGILVRIRLEERTLTEALGDDYRQYAAATARLVPLVW